MDFRLWVMVATLSFTSGFAAVSAEKTDTSVLPSAKPAADPSKAIITAVPPIPLDTPRDISHTRMKATATSVRGDYWAAAKAIDGNPNTGWSSKDIVLSKDPQSLDIELDAPYQVDALRYYLAAAPNRAAYVSWLCRAKEYLVQVSLDGKTYQNVASGKWDKTDLREQRVAFKPVEARFVRITFLSADTDRVAATEIALESPAPPTPVGELVQAPADADARRTAFAKRHTPEQIKLISNQLYRIVNRQALSLQEFVKLHENRDHAAALRSFNRMFIERILSSRQLFEDVLIFYPDDMPETATLLMGNIIRSRVLLSTYIVGAPGAINWDHPRFDEEMMSRLSRALPPDTFDPLLWRFRSTGERPYLEKWADYVDDFAINYRGYSKLTSFTILDNDSHAFQRMEVLLYRLLQLETERPGALASLLPDTLPRLLLKIIPEDVAISCTYYHANAQNWTPHTAPRMVKMGLIIDDLITQDIPLLERGMRMMETYDTCSNMPDGTEAEQAMWYNWAYAHEAMLILKLLENAGTAATTVPQSRRQELLETAVRRFRFTTHIFDQKGQWPIFLRGDRRTFFGMEELARSKPEDGYKPSVITPAQRKLLLADRCIGPMAAKISLDKKTDAKLPFNSSYFPWGGYRVIRENWRPDSQCGSMFSSPMPGKYQARGDTEQLNFGLHAFGMDLLTDGTPGHYGGVQSQVRVDNLNQCFRVGYPLWGHKQILLNGWTKPDGSRWLSCERFDFMEGRYSGPYGNHTAFAPEEIATENREAVQGITHHRQVVFVRDAGLWIVTDRLVADKPRDFTWNWVLPCSVQKEQPPAFLPEEIIIDEAGKRIITSKQDQTNLTMQTFCAPQLSYRRQELANSKTCEIQATAKAQKDILAITSILPRKTQQDDFKSLSQLKSEDFEGFSAITPDGSKVICTVARKSPAALSAVPVIADAEILLTVEKDGRISVLTLGCKSLSVDGVKLKSEYTDFAFSFQAADSATSYPLLPVFRPVELVSINPSRSVFIGKENITLTCPTANVEIRYTLNGEEPTSNSPLYKEPITIQETTRVRARAFRPNQNEPDGAMDFTVASPESTALYERQTPRAAVKVASRQPGLGYRYYQGDWQKLYLNSALLEPDATGVIPSALDISPRKTKGPFTFVYEGFINVPENGVYTFHAPFEYMDNKIDNGYELLLEIDGTQWQPATRRHAFGDWSIALAKGFHSFQLKYLDYRGEHFQMLMYSPDKKPMALREMTIDYTLKENRPNFPGMNGNYFWGGGAPELLISGPGINRKPIPKEWFLR